MRTSFLSLIVVISIVYPQLVHGEQEWNKYCVIEAPQPVGLVPVNPPYFGRCDGTSYQGLIDPNNPTCFICKGNLVSLTDLLNQGRQETAAVRKELATQASDLKEWRALALTAVLDRIDQMPGKFAANEAVTKAVGAQVAAFLMKDPEFMAKLREVLSSSKTTTKKK